MGHGSVPQTRWVISRVGACSGHDRQPVVVGQPAQGLGVLADRVGPDHDLDAVVAQPGRDLEGRRAVERVRRGRRQRDLAPGHPARRRDTVGGDLELGHAPTLAAWGPGSLGRLRSEAGSRSSSSVSSRRRMTPSRSAQGQISSCSTPSRSIAASATSAPASSWPARSGETPGSARRWAARQRRPAGRPGRRRRAARSSRAAYGPSEEGAAPATRASERSVLDVPTTRSGVPVLTTPRTHGPDLDPDVPAQRADVVGAGRVARQVLAGEPAGAQRQAQRGVRHLVHARPRSPASRRRCRAPAGARWTSRTSGVRRGRSAGPRPGRTAPAAARRCWPGCRPAPPRRWGPRGSRWWRRRARPGRPGPRRSAARRTMSTRARRTRRRRSGRPRGTRPAAATPCGSTPGAGGRPGCASTTSRCTVLEPMSSTPSRMRERVAKPP